MYITGEYMTETVFERPRVGVPVRSAAQSHAAHLEQTLLQARRLIESTVTLHRRRPSASGVMQTDAGVTTETLEQLIFRARRSVSVSFSGSVGFVEAVLRCLGHVPDGVSVRILCTPTAADAASAQLHSRPDVRVFRHDLREVVVVDGSFAFLRSPGKGAAVVTDTATVSAMEMLYVGVWSRGRKLGDHLELSPRLRTELTRRILERMRAGRTDAAAARELQVSLRTYRRHVAEIMRELEASSRFAAGVRAVEVGLLPQEH